MKHGYLIDMDGVLYRGSEMIPGADSFIRELRLRDIPFRFLTNNSQRTRRDIVAKLNRMGIDVVARMEAGMETVLVLSGVTQPEEIDRYPYRPTRVLPSVADFLVD